jgi:hypothetical protein
MGKKNRPERLQRHQQPPHQIGAQNTSVHRERENAGVIGRNEAAALIARRRENSTFQE